MVPDIKYYLVGGYLREDSIRHDIDIVGVLSKRDFERVFGTDHVGLMQDLKDSENPRGKRWMEMNVLMGVVLTQWFGKHVDFKWCSPTMLYLPHQKMELSLNVEMEL